MEIVRLAEQLGVDDTDIVDIIKHAGINCETELEGLHVSIFSQIRTFGLNLIKLHLNQFGSFPILALPGVNLFCWMFPELFNETGINILFQQAQKDVPEFDAPKLSHEELFNVVQFLSCIWADIRVELYQYSFLIRWRPLISFENPVYYKKGDMIPWDKSCNILRAELLEILNSTSKFLYYSYGDYHKQLGSIIFKRKRSKRTNPVTAFPILNAYNEDIYNYPGVACLDTEASRKTACNMLTIIRGLLARLCCMLLRIPADSIVVNTTTWNTLADDLKQLYHIIQKMEGYLNN